MLKLQKEDSKYTNIATQNKAKLTTCVPTVSMPLGESYVP
jgi:hypothetical protein